MKFSKVSNEPLDESPDEAPAEPSTDLDTLETLDDDDDDDDDSEDLDTLKAPDKPLDEALDKAPIRSGKSSADLWKQTVHSPALQIRIGDIQDQPPD